MLIELPHSAEIVLTTARDSAMTFDSRKQDRSLVSMLVDMSNAILQNTLSAKRAEISEY